MKVDGWIDIDEARERAIGFFISLPLFLERLLENGTTDALLMRSIREMYRTVFVGSGIDKIRKSL